VLDLAALQKLPMQLPVFFESTAEAAWDDAEIFPLHARQLGLALEESHTQRTYSSSDEWMKLQPEYWGDTRFGAAASTTVTP